MKKLLLVAALAFGSVAAHAQLNLNKVTSSLTGGKLTQAEIEAGLKEALTKGATNGTDIVSKADGFFGNPAIKIPFPPEVQQVESKLRQLGMGSEVDKFVLSLNRAAEDAAIEAKPIFVGAIKQMTFQDAVGIFKGQPDAATQYLNRTTSPQLKEKFQPVIKQSLDKTNATKYYADLIKTYNKLPFVKKVNPDLNSYATDKAIQGLFVMVAQEEKNIRQNPGARTTDILKNVFGSK